MVKIDDHKGVDDNGYSKKIISQPCHLGASKLLHSKKNERCYNCFRWVKNYKKYYSDTDSVYIHKNDYEVLEKVKINWLRSISIKKRLR